MMHCISETVYEGTAARVINQQHHSGSFVCAFDVFYYPFDVQHCNVLVQLASISKKLVFLTESRAETEFNKNSELSTYIISDFFVKEVNTTSRESIMEVRQYRSLLKVLIKNKYLISINL